LDARAFSGKVETGFPQKMRPKKNLERFHDPSKNESALEFFGEDGPIQKPTIKLA
jgi:hypothetical protein